jgi:CheY-like chemotaxis protein
LVEPDLQVAEAFKTWFSEAGCEVYAVASREQALALAGEKDFGLIVMDLMDPRLGGLAALEQIRQARPGAEIVVTASRFDADLMDSALDIGALTVLRRPVAKADVQRLAEAHLGAHDRVRRGGRDAPPAGQSSAGMVSGWTHEPAMEPAAEGALSIV